MDFTFIVDFNFFYFPAAYSVFPTFHFWLVYNGKCARKRWWLKAICTRVEAWGKDDWSYAAEGIWRKCHEIFQQLNLEISKNWWELKKMQDHFWAVWWVLLPPLISHFSIARNISFYTHWHLSTKMKLYEESLETYETWISFSFFLLFLRHTGKKMLLALYAYTLVYISHSLIPLMDTHTQIYMCIHTYESASHLHGLLTFESCSDYELRLQRVNTMKEIAFSVGIFFFCYYFNNFHVTFSLKYWGMLLNFWTVDALNSLRFYDCYLIHVVQVYNYFSYCTNIFLKPSKFKNILCFMWLYDNLS